MNHPKEYQRLAHELRARLFEMGFKEEQIRNVPSEAIRDVMIGAALLVVKRGPDICDCCQGLKVRVLLAHPTIKPLEEIFSSTKKHK